MATPQQRLEVMVLDWIDRVQKGGRIEDSIVECKSDWPTDHRKAARQIAALANSALGADVFWLIGIDENAHTLSTPSPVELANWWPQVKSHFDQVPPDLKLDLNVQVDETNQVQALWLETSRAPYVIKTDAQHPAEREVPWRDGTRTRSAHRHELELILGPTIRLPEAELRRVEANGIWEKTQATEAKRGLRVQINARLLFVPRNTDPLFIPHENISGKVSLMWSPDSPPFAELKFDWAAFDRSDNPRGAITTSEGLSITGPDIASIQAVTEFWGLDLGPENSPDDILPQTHSVTVDVNLRVAGIDRPIVLTSQLVLAEATSGTARWKQVTP
jgi:hypothetical protein